MIRMKVLMAHNYYREAGGEDESFKAESGLLQARGCSVSLFTRDNNDIRKAGIISKINLVRRTIWAEDSVRDLRVLIKREKPHIVHFQNTFPLISPAAYQVCFSEGIPVVQSLRNYRLLCPNALFFRDNHPCEDCLGKVVPWPGVWHACYRESHIQSAVVASMLAYHHRLKTWKTQVDMYIALSEFSRQKFIEGGIVPEKIVVKPNFVIDRGYNKEREDYVVFVGRLSREKGLFTMLDGWRRLSHIPLVIIGGGPLHGELLTFIDKENLPHVKLMGRLPNSDALEIIRHARFLIFPSEWYETFGRVVIEAYSMGLPVIASRIGAVTELIHDNGTGLLFDVGDPSDLAEKVDWLWTHPKESTQMGKDARKEYEDKYTPERNFNLLMNIYSNVIKDHKS